MKVPSIDAAARRTGWKIDMLRVNDTFSLLSFPEHSPFPNLLIYSKDLRVMRELKKVVHAGWPTGEERGVMAKEERLSERKLDGKKKKEKRVSKVEQGDANTLRTRKETKNGDSEPSKEVYLAERVKAQE